MSLTFTKEQQDFARKNKLAWFGAGINGKYAPNNPPTGKYACYGPCELSLARFLFLLCLDLTMSDKRIKVPTEKELRDAFEKHLKDFIQENLPPQPNPSSRNGHGLQPKRKARKSNRR